MPNNIANNYVKIFDNIGIFDILQQCAYEGDCRAYSIVYKET